jgi:hypothetical protein
MASETQETRIDAQIAGHASVEAASLERLRVISMEERSQLIEAACRAAAVVLRDRAATGALPVRPIRWPPSTCDFLKRHAVRVRTESTD